MLNPESKVHGANVGSTWGRQDPGGLHVGHMNFAIWEEFNSDLCISNYTLHEAADVITYPYTNLG